MLSKRLFDGCRETSPSATLQHSPLSTPSLKTLVPQNSLQTNFHKEYLTSPDSTDKGFFRRFLHRRALDQSATRLPEFFSVPVGEKLRDMLRGIDIPGDRLRLDDLSPPAWDPAIGESLHGLSVDDARKILRLAQVEKLKAKLRDIPQSSIPYSEFSRICVEVCENEEQGVEFAKMLDSSGNVIVLGNIVFLRPEQVQLPYSRNRFSHFPFFSVIFTFMKPNYRINLIPVSVLATFWCSKIVLRITVNFRL